MVCASRPAARLLRTGHSSSVRTTRLIMRLLLRFELPGWYFGTTRLIVRLVVQRIIRLVVYYQLKAGNPGGNQAVSFVVIYMLYVRCHILVCLYLPVYALWFH